MCRPPGHDIGHAAAYDRLVPLKGAGDGYVAAQVPSCWCETYFEPVCAMSHKPSSFPLDSSGAASRERAQVEGSGRSPRPVLIRVGGARPADRPWGGPAARTLITVAAAVAVAVIAARVPARWAPLALLAAPVVVLMLVLVRRLEPKVVPGGPCGLDFPRLGSVLILGRTRQFASHRSSVSRLVGSLLFVSGRSSAQRANVGQRSLAVLLLVFGLSLIPVLVIDPNGFFSPFVSWARLVETFTHRLAHAICDQAPIGCAFHHGDGGRCVRHRARAGHNDRQRRSAWPDYQGDYR